MIEAADTAWMLVATALVLLMTPALAFFYGGLVRSSEQRDRSPVARSAPVGAPETRDRTASVRHKNGAQSGPSERLRQ